jgi:hypothetical protein
MADWLDDSFGHHIYGVRFPGDKAIYRRMHCIEVSLHEAGVEIERLALHARLVEAEIARKDELLRDAVSYLVLLEANMLQNGDDMLLDECDPPSLVADRLRAALEGEKDNGNN